MGRKSLGRIQEEENLEQLPVSRIKTIMKSSPDVEGIRKEALFLVNKATEYFIQFLTSTAHMHSKGTRELNYDSLSEIVRGDMRLSFMADLFPKRITYKEYKEIIARKKEGGFKFREALSWEEEEEDDDEENESGQMTMESDSGSGQYDEDPRGETKRRSHNGSSNPKEYHTPRNSSELSDSISMNSESVLSENSSIREDNKEEEENDDFVVSECDKEDNHDDMEEAMVID